MDHERDDWRPLLRDARRRLGINQHDLAERAGLSFETVRGYENGRRKPRREHLQAVLDALKIDRGQRNTIMQAAGFAPDGLELRPQDPGLFYSAGEAAEEVERYPWPAFVVNEYMELIAANSAMTLLWDVDLSSEFTGVAERNLLTAATNPRFSDRCLSWDETVGKMVAAFKGHHRGPEDPANPGVYFQQVVKVLAGYDAAYLKRVLDLWDSVEPLPAKLRWSYPVVWEHPGAGVMRFTCFASSANEADGLSFNDWIPVDAESWRVLEAVKARDVRL